MSGGEAVVPIEWTSDLDTGIDVIDGQHRQLVQYINPLEEANATSHRESLGDVLASLFDYTTFHFAFEESLLEQIEYPALIPHREAHDRFAKRIAGYGKQFGEGQDIGLEMHKLLCSWLLNHIKYDDADYAGKVRVKIDNTLNSGWLRRTLRRLAGD